MLRTIDINKLIDTKTKTNTNVHSWKYKSYNEYQLNLYHRKRANDYEVNAKIFRRILA